jgi:hypothetical protein
VTLRAVVESVCGITDLVNSVSRQPLLADAALPAALLTHVFESAALTGGRNVIIRPAASADHNRGGDDQSASRQIIIFSKVQWAGAARLR